MAAAAAPNCAAARAVGLAPAYRGQPGYYPQHDRDGLGYPLHILAAAIEKLPLPDAPEWRELAPKCGRIDLHAKDDRTMCRAVPTAERQTPVRNAGERRG